MFLNNFISPRFLSKAKEKVEPLPAQSDAASHNRFLPSSSARIWQSRLSWRIAISVFLTILSIQILILILNFPQEESKLLQEVREIGRSSIASILENNTRMLNSPLQNDAAERLLTSTIIKGLSVYSTDLLLLSSHGEPVSMVLLNQDSLARTYRSIDGNAYEVVYRPEDLKRPYIIVARLNAGNIRPTLLEYIQETLLIMFCMSAFVTTVLMIVLGQWLLEPILFMRFSLIEASKNPENPKITPSPFNSHDEIGEAIIIAQQLIQQNAANMQQVRAAAEEKIHKLAY